MAGVVMHFITTSYFHPRIQILSSSLWSHMIHVLGISQGPFGKEKHFKTSYLCLLVSLSIGGQFSRVDLVCKFSENLVATLVVRFTIFFSFVLFKVQSLAQLERLLVCPDQKVGPQISARILDHGYNIVCWAKLIHSFET